MEANETLFAYLDDVYAVTSPERTRPVYDLLGHHLQSMAGIQLHADKIRVWNRAGQCRDEVEDLGEEVWRAETDFGQTDFGHPYLTDFGQTDFGQFSVYFPVFPKGGAPKGGAPKGGAKGKGGGRMVGAQNFALFFPSPATVFHSFLPLFWSFSWNFGGV